MKKIFLWLVIFFWITNWIFAYEVEYDNPTWIEIPLANLSEYEETLYFYWWSQIETVFCWYIDPNATLISYVYATWVSWDKLYNFGSYIWITNTTNTIQLTNIVCDFPEVFTVTSWIIGWITWLVTGVFISLASLIVSPLGGFIIFGLAISYLFYVKKMAKASNAKR